MTGRRKWIGWAIVALVVACCIPFWPKNLGGRTTYVTTHGTSMAPRFHAGDLAIVQPASTYKVGQVVAYHSTTLDATVMHRIVSIAGDRYTFKGDNNDFLDPDTPTRAQLIGSLRVRVPKGGAIRAWLARPIILVPLGALCALAITMTATRRKPRRSRPRSGASGRYRIPTLTNASRRRLRRVAPRAAVLAAVGCLVGAVAVWNIPRSERTTTRVAYQQHAILGYSASAPAGAAYADGRIRTGDPVFTRLVDRLDVNLSYDFSSAGASSDAAGTYDVVAELSSATGWHRELVLLARQSFDGGSVRTRAPLDLSAVRALQDRFRAETGLATNSLGLSLAARVHVALRVDGSPVESDLAPTLSFQLTPVEMQPVVTPGSTNAAPGSAATVTKDGSVAAAGRAEAGLRLWKVRLPIPAARTLSILLIAAALAAGAAVLAADRRRAARGDLANLLARYGNYIVEVDELPGGGRLVVRVATMRALARLARTYEAPILRAGNRFVLFAEGGTAYAYDLGPAARGRPGPAMASA